jgi:hypothetical protein
MSETETRIYRRLGDGDAVREELIGAIDSHGIVFRLGSGRRYPVGRVDQERRVFRTTKYSDREVGSYTAEGRVRSHGLFEGGELGWVDETSVVIQGGLIFGEQEVGSVEGPNPQAGAAALLLLLLPDDSEADKQVQR